MNADNRKKKMDDRQLRLDLVHVFGSDSEQVVQLDDLFHRLWTATPDDRKQH